MRAEILLSHSLMCLNAQHKAHDLIPGIKHIGSAVTGVQILGQPHTGSMTLASHLISITLHFLIFTMGNGHWEDQLGNP